MNEKIKIGQLRLQAVILTLLTTISFYPVSAQEAIPKSDFVFVKGGCFSMGDMYGDGADHERPVHEVCLSDYYLSKFEVTQDQYQKVMGNNPALNQENSQYPIDIVSWWDVERFIEKLNTETGMKYRLPTEAEWEYACRAGGKQIQFGTKDGTLSDEYVLHSVEGEKGHGIMPVGSFPPNQLGIHDMSGSVSEWVMDWYERDFYAKSPKKNPVVLTTRMETLKMRRGGYWGDKGVFLRCSFRNYRRPALRLIGLGFRLAMDVDVVINRK